MSVKWILEDPQRARMALEKRGAAQSGIDEIVALEARRKSLAKAISENNALRKKISKSRGQESDDRMEGVGLRERSDDLAGQIALVERELKGVMDQLPNAVDNSVPEGGKENNKVISYSGVKPDFGYNFRDHVDLSEDLGLIDHARGVKLGGTGYWIYTGLGAALEWSLLNYFCRRHYADGYRFVLPPHILNTEAGYIAGQFPKFDDDVFHVVDGENRDSFLVPTAETAMAAMYGGEILERGVLPMQLFAVTPCYRREAGGYRHGERGTIRGHQFNKVELFEITEPHASESAHQQLLGRVESLLDDLGLHYRTSLLAAGDTGFAMSKTYDVEVWIPSLGEYKEVSSVSCAKDFQSRRGKIRYRGADSKAQYVHTLNASGLATSRLFPALLEQGQQPDGSVKIPEVLAEWLGTDLIKKGGLKV